MCGLRDVRQTLVTRLGSGLVAEHCHPAALLDVLVGQHDHDVDGGHEDYEVDNRPDEGAEVDESLLVACIAELQAQPEGCMGLCCGDQRIDHTVGESLDQVRERQGHDQPDGNGDHVTPHYEISESFEHECHLRHHEINKATQDRPKKP